MGMFVLTLRCFVVDDVFVQFDGLIRIVRKPGEGDVTLFEDKNVSFQQGRSTLIDWLFD